MTELGGGSGGGEHGGTSLLDGAAAAELAAGPDGGTAPEGDGQYEPPKVDGLTEL